MVISEMVTFRDAFNTLTGSSAILLNNTPLLDKAIIPNLVSSVGKDVDTWQGKFYQYYIFHLAYAYERDARLEFPDMYWCYSAKIGAYVLGIPFTGKSWDDVHTSHVKKLDTTDDFEE